MLDIDTKRRIDSCRDILVGKVPDPKSQVEQITIALIYKFMDDMDAKSEEFGGKRSFFVSGFEKYSWSKLLAPSMGGQDTLNLYSEAIGKMTENTHLPALFRDIFKNAYLPYRDPETLKAFLKEIDGFSYDHSERLGDAFEYLLSVLGSQGDAGQFRTPRHIIDFIVRVINPHKHERILDPACGTAGFLISAWKYILDQNKGHKPGDKLTPVERNKLAANIHGYDISPDMVRLSLVNLYLHGFTDPHVDEYDTLTSEDKWNEHADIILANPPFMSPKGGIKPHKRFSIQAKRSEVLFVDYIHEHLSPNGRAGIIVPEGIIFQSGTAYKALRKLLVQNSLVAVVSLPAGVFQPYSGVKTSILILDKRLAKQTDKVLFVKVSNDGFALGAQRRSIEQDDLPQAGLALETFFTNPTGFEDGELAQAVERKKIAENGEWSLSADRYMQVTVALSQYRQVEIGSVIKTVTPPIKFQKDSYLPTGRYPIIDQSQNDIAGFTDDEAAIISPEKPLVVFGDHTCAVKLIREPFVQGADGIKILQTSDDLLPEFLFHFLKVHPLETDGYKRHFTDLKRKTIPLPPINIQRKTVAEIESYQKIIDGARQVVDNYQPRIVVNPEWPKIRLSEIIRLSSGEFLSNAMKNDGPYLVYGGNGINGVHDQYFLEEPTIVIGRVGAYCGAVHLTEPKSWITDNGLYVKETLKPVDLAFLALSLRDLNLNQYAKVGGQPSISQSIVLERKIAFPEIEIQQSIVAELNLEQALIDANKELITRFEVKIKTAIDRVWAN
ncbi:restriction endonuclease subunit S [Aeromonas bestiarum]|uniref:N-6 DNA methylase n=1 Tax=Aeromonas bestiarum TaxID=105751 RepID=UPI000CD488D2|nr:N-6 DNA methylase [Aeromonas bestiarum]POG22252.1 restriction endonuclease subunit S [Aeromonas bestiarum]